MENSQFKCSKCGYTVERTKQYLMVLEAQNFINIVMNNAKIIDLCGRCNCFEYEK